MTSQGYPGAIPLRIKENGRRHLAVSQRAA
jgi:hypothetical protein